jgi:hypothetical protein
MTDSGRVGIAELDPAACLKRRHTESCKRLSIIRIEREASAAPRFVCVDVACHQSHDHGRPEVRPPGGGPARRQWPWMALPP